MAGSTTAQRGRPARKEATRRRLLDAAMALVAEKGLGGASVAEIAQRAGLTTGAVYSNFRSKQALLLALVLETEAEQSPADPVASAPGLSGDDLVQHLVRTATAAARYADTAHSRRLVLLQAELFLMALRDRSLRRELRSTSRAQVESLAGVLATIREVEPPGPPPEPALLAETFFACIQGLQQHRLLDPERAPDELFAWLAQALLFAARAGEPRPRQQHRARQHRARGAR